MRWPSRSARPGCRSTSKVEGDPARLPAGVDLSGYRIVQEALTNTLRHAGPAHARVVVRCAERHVDISVCDDGTGGSGANGTGPGHGPPGIRERVSLYGGELRTGPRLGGGYEVIARPTPARQPMSVRVLLADDERLVRAGFRMILNAEPDIEIVGEAADGHEAVAAARRLRPDVVLMDIRMPGLNGIDATTRLLDHYARHSPTASASANDVLAQLTARETDVFRSLVARGQSSAEIARELWMSEHTVKTHVAHLLAKLGLRDRVQAVVLAYESGLVATWDDRDPA